MKKKFLVVVGIIIVFFGCGLLTYAAANSGPGGDSNPSLENLGGAPKANAGEGSTDMVGGTVVPGLTKANAGEGSTDMVGGGMLNPCAANPGLQIQPLVENGQVVTNAFVGLDLNQTEVDAGLRYVIDVPEDAYVQYFQAWDGTTWEATGPTTVIATAWTAWCNNAGWIGQLGFPNGKHRMLNANNLPDPMGQWISRN